MTDLPPELFSERPVSSDFNAHGPSYAVRRFITLAVVLLLIGGGLYWAFGGTPTGNPQDIPVIKAEGNYKQRPEQPGGIDIPHQDVQVYQELDANNNDKAQVEHLLPPPETPQVPTTQTPMAVPQPVVPHIESLMTDATLSANTISLPPTGPIAAPPVATASIAPVPSAATPAVAGIQAKVPDAALQKNIVLPAPDQLSLVPSVHAPKSASPAASPVPVVSTVASVSGVNTKSASLTIEQIIKNTSQSTTSTSQVPAVLGKGHIVQLASLPDQLAAQKMAHQLQSKYATALGSIMLHVVRADLVKGTYYRIQGQAISEQQARNICASLKKLNTGCILVPTR